MDLRLPYYMMYPIPYAFDEDKIQKRDREYLQSMYPATAKKIFPYIQEECDRQEYEGSMIYDEYPDKLQLCLMCRRAYEQVMKQEKWEKETYTPEQIREIVEILMYQELIERRGKGRTVSREKCSGDRDMAEWICDIFRGDGGDDGGSEDGGAGKHCPISAGTLAEPE